MNATPEILAAAEDLRRAQQEYADAVFARTRDLVFAAGTVYTDLDQWCTVAAHEVHAAEQELSRRVGAQRARATVDAWMLRLGAMWTAQGTAQA